MTTTDLAPPARGWTAAELCRLPPDQRDAILSAAANRAAADYTHDPNLTAFEAFGPDEQPVLVEGVEIRQSAG
jgi:hypothetical protein